MHALPEHKVQTNYRPHYYDFLKSLDPLDVLFTKYRQHGLCPPNRWARIIIKDADILQWTHSNGRNVDIDRGLAMVLAKRMTKAMKEGRIWIEDGQAYTLFKTFFWHDKPRPRKWAFVPCDMPKDLD